MAVRGSTEAARRAGSQAAATPTNASAAIQRLSAVAPATPAAAPAAT